MSILFQEDGLVFSILRNDLAKFIVLGDYELKGEAHAVDSLFYFRDQLQGVFANYLIGYYTAQLSLIPASLFDAERLAEYGAFQFEENEDWVLQYDTLKTHGTVLVYPVPKQVKAIVDLYFPGVKLRHAAAYTIAFYLNLYKNKPGEHLHMQVWRKHIEVIAVKNGKLLLFNSFAFETDEDLLYFILNIYEQLELNPETLPLKISGEMEKHSKVWELLLTYIRYIEIEERPANFQFSHEFKSVQNHRYNRVFQAATCAL